MKQVLHVALALSLLGPAAATAQPYQQGGPQDQRHGQDNRAGGNQGRPAPGGRPAGPPNRGPARPGPARPMAMEPHGGPRGGPPQGGPRRGHQGNWNRGERYDGHRYVLDWRRHRLRQPPRGYEWVNVNGQFLLIAITTGVIADIFLNAR